MSANDWHTLTVDDTTGKDLIGQYGFPLTMDICLLGEDTEIEVVHNKIPRKIENQKNEHRNFLTFTTTGGQKTEIIVKKGINNSKIAVIEYRFRLA